MLGGWVQDELLGRHGLPFFLDQLRAMWWQTTPCAPMYMDQFRLWKARIIIDIEKGLWKACTRTGAIFQGSSVRCHSKATLRSRSLRGLQHATVPGFLLVENPLYVSASGEIPRLDKVSVSLLEQYIASVCGTDLLDPCCGS